MNEVNQYKSVNSFESIVFIYNVECRYYIIPKIVQKHGVVWGLPAMRCCENQFFLFQYLHNICWIKQNEHTKYLVNKRKNINTHIERGTSYMHITSLSFYK